MPLKYNIPTSQMPRLLRIGGLMLLLLGPLVLFFLLQLTATNHYELPTYFETPDSTLRSTSLGNINCLPHNYPYTVFAHPSGEQFARKNTHSYLLHNISANTNIKNLELFYKKVSEKGTLQLHAFVEWGTSATLPKAQAKWQTTSLSYQGLSYIRDCVLHVSDLFEEGMPANWAVLLDSRGRIRGFFDPNDEDDFRKGLAEGFILQDSPAPSDEKARAETP